jgi:hypothetical protein
MRQVVLLGIFSLFFAVARGGGDVTGRVLDSSTGQPLAYATIVLEARGHGVISDESGAFRLLLDDATARDTIAISYVGYQTLRLTAEALLQNPDCLLEPYVFPIDEVTVRPVDAEDILRLAYDGFYANHVHEDMATYGYYREQIFDENRCVRYGEAVFATRFYKEDGKDMAALQPFLGRSIDDSTFLRKFNSIFNNKRLVIPIGVNEYEENDMISNFTVDQYYEMLGEFFFSEKNNGYRINYKRRDNYIQQGRESYFISFEIYKKKTHIATGHILIDRSTYGIAAFEIDFREQENLTRLILPPKIRLAMKILGYGADIGDFQAKLYNRYDDGRWFIGRGVMILEGGIARRRNWVNGKLVNEFHAFYSNEYAAPDTAARFRDIRVNDFSPEFWEGYAYSPIQPRQQEYIQSIIDRNNTFEGEVFSRKVLQKIAEKKALPAE